MQEQYPNIDELLHILDTYTIIKEQLPIKDNTYCSGYVIPEDKSIVLNRSNCFKSNVDTLSHELMHVWYDHYKGIHLKESEIEDIAQRQTVLVPEYRRRLEERIYNIK